MDYFKKQEKPLFKDLEWNFPEQKSNVVAVVGGHGNNFSNVIKLSEYLAGNYPVKTVATILPDVLRGKLPNFPGLFFTPSTESGSFAKSKELNSHLETADFSILAGDFSKNSATTIAIVDAIKDSGSPVLLVRDAVDLVESSIGEIIEDSKLFLLVSMPQLQKIFRSLLYPKMLLLSAPLLPTVETLHKFTLSYESCTIITLHQGQILIASQGKVIATPHEKTKYNSLSFYTSTLPANLAAYNLWNPKKPLEASASALFR